MFHAFFAYVSIHFLFVITVRIQANMKRLGEYKVTAQDAHNGLYIVSRMNAISSTNNTGTHQVRITSDGKVKECDCTRLELMPCVHLLVLGKFLNILKDMFSSEETLLQWFHLCFLQSSIVAAYELVINPAMSDANELVPDDLIPIIGNVKAGAPQKLRFASTGAQVCGDNTGAKARKTTCSNCWGRDHSKQNCKYPVLDDTTRARVVAERLQARTEVLNNTVPVRSLQHENFGTLVEEYVSIHSITYLHLF